MPMIYRTAALAAVGIFVTYVWKCIFVAPHQNLESRALALLRSSPLIDGHNDFPAQIRVRHEYRIYDNVQFTFEHGMETETDGVKIKQGYLGGQFWSVWTECPSDNAGDAGPLDCSVSIGRGIIRQI